MFILNSLILIPEIFGHSDVFYEKVNRNPWVTWPSFILGNGIYHYLHHSAEEKDAVIINGMFKGTNRKVNMINMIILYRNVFRILFVFKCSPFKCSPFQ